MARQTTKNFQAALRKNYAKRFGFIQEIGSNNNTTNPLDSNVDGDFDNGATLSWSDAADTTSISGMAVDADSKVHVDRSVNFGQRGSQTFALNANASLATQAFFIADRTTLITGITYSHSTLGTDSGAVTANITHDTGTQAAGTGTTVQVGTFNCKATINTPQIATLAAVQGNGAPAAVLLLAAGDRLSIVFTGTLTSLAGVILTVYTAAGAKEEVAQYNMNANSTIATQGIFLANRDMVVTGVSMFWGTAGTDAGAVTADVTKDTSTNAPGAGTTILAATQSLKAAANTVVNPALSATASVLKLAAGDRLSFKLTGTPTALAGLVICVYLQASSATVGTSLPYYGQVEAGFSLKANGALGSQAIFIADRDYEVVDASATWSTATGGGGTLDFTIDKGTTAPAGGTSVMSGTIDISTTANTTNVGTMSVSRRNRLMSAGDRLSVKLASLASLAGLDVTLSLLPR